MESLAGEQSGAGEAYLYALRSRGLQAGTINKRLTAHSQFNFCRHGFHKND